MTDFLLAIHRDLTSKNPVPTPEQMREAMEPYSKWLAELAASKKLAAPPKRWDLDGRVVTKSATVHKGPYAERKESIGGLLLVRAEDYDEAVEIARGCPIIKYGAIVEVRMAISAA
jgi:hypothetical protein